MAAAAEAMWAPAAFRFLRAAASKTAAVARQKLGAVARPFTNVAATVPTVTATAKAATAASSFAHRAQQSSKPVNDILRRFFSTVTPPAHVARATTQRTSIAQETFARFRQSTGRAPFANTLRPSLTGGALPRGAGGYGLGAGGARYFSHSPTAPAEVINNVSQAMRAFMLNGKRAKYDGMNRRGEKCYRAVSSAEDEASRKLAATPRFAPGAYIDFRLSPTVTALSPLLAAAFPYAAATQKEKKKEEAAAATTTTLCQEGLLDFLTGDFERAARDLAAILADLKRLASLGDLPITLEGPSLLRVRFPGVDADAVERLCEDAGIHRGYIGQDPGFDALVGVEMALRFPFAPDGGAANDARVVLTPPGGSVRSLESDDFLEDADAYLDEFEFSPWLSDPEGHDSGLAPPGPGSSDFEGLEGIYRFLEECDRARGAY